MKSAPVNSAPPPSPDLQWAVESARKIAAHLRVHDGIVGLEDEVREATRDIVEIEAKRGDPAAPRAANVAKMKQLSHVFRSLPRFDRDVLPERSRFQETYRGDFKITRSASQYYLVKDPTEDTLHKDVRNTFRYHHTTPFVIWHVPDDGFKIRQGHVHKEDGVWDHADMGDDMTGLLRVDHRQPLVTDERSPRFGCSRIDLTRTPRTIYVVWTLVDSCGLSQRTGEARGR